jgi:GMP synthase-like glutamine amidotransferase
MAADPLSKPVLVVQHTEVGAPGAVLPILESLGAPVRLLRVVDGEPVPADPSPYAGLVFMGGYMGVHDPIPWIAQELDLIRRADALGIPVAGHCLGSQMLAFALGGAVRKHTQQEISWGEITAESGAAAAEWLGEYAGKTLETFQWHGDTFEPPPGAQRLASGRYCANQMFALGGKHLLVQSHLEMDPALIELSLARNGALLEREVALGNPAAATRAETLREMPARTARMHAILRQLYTRWLRAAP